jgi:hypothetical protein
VESEIDWIEVVLFHAYSHSVSDDPKIVSETKRKQRDQITTRLEAFFTNQIAGKGSGCQQSADRQSQNWMQEYKAECKSAGSGGTLILIGRLSNIYRIVLPVLIRIAN